MERRFMKKYNDFAGDVFACVLQHGPENIDLILQLINSDVNQLYTAIWKDLYQIIVKYFRLTGQIISQEDFIDSINNSSTIVDDKRKKYFLLFDSLRIRPVQDGKFKFYMQQLIDFVTQQKCQKMLANAQQASRGGLTIASKTYEGYSGVRKILFENLNDIDRLIADYSPEGDANQESDGVLDEYRKLQERDDYISTGFSEIDKCTGGLYPGELWLWVGYAAEGKTFSCINIGHHAAYIQQKNVVFFTSETVRSVVRRRLISRHAKHLTGNGLNLTAWKKGELSSKAYEVLQKTLKDMKNGSEYGKFYIIQMPANADTDFVAAALTRCQALFKVDLCILDSIHLLKPKKIRQSEYSELGDMLIDIKKTIVSHNNGRGVPLISPWHTNRTAWENAKERGVYTKSALAKSSEAERCADVIVTILREDELRDQLRGSIIKSRDGEELSEFYLTYDFSQGYIGDSPVSNFDTVDLLGDLNSLGTGSDKNCLSKELPAN